MSIHDGVTVSISKSDSQLFVNVDTDWTVGKIFVAEKVYEPLKHIELELKRMEEIVFLAN